MQGIGDLPVELLFIITDQISRKDILNFRLCAPRNMLPFLDAIVFREIDLSIDTSDGFERWEWEDVKEGVALQRLVDISQSRIVKYVRVLVLRIARPYEPITAFGMFLFAFFCYPAYWYIRRQETRGAEKGSTIPAHHNQWVCNGLAPTSDGFHATSETSETSRPIYSIVFDPTPL